MGAFIIAAINTLRAILTYIEAQTDVKEPSTLQKVMLRCAHCVLNCLQCIFDRVNKNGFIICAINGFPFCASSFRGLRLIFANILRVAALTMVSEYLQFIGKICIMGICTTACVFTMMYADEYEGEVVSILFPAICVALISYIIASLYMLVFQVGIDTTFMCFLIDETVNPSNRLRAHEEVRRLFVSAEKESLEMIAGKTDASSMLHLTMEQEQEIREFEAAKHRTKLAEVQNDMSQANLEMTNFK